jgi:hypothetical protein
VQRMIEEVALVMEATGIRIGKEPPARMLLSWASGEEEMMTAVVAMKRGLATIDLRRLINDFTRNTPCIM